MTLFPAPSQDELFDPAFLSRLEAFTLRLPFAKRGRRLAEQRTSARGQGTDFKDFKPYVPGDDLRTIDWNIYARLGKTFVRVFEEHHDLPVHILVDCSHSMFVEDPLRPGQTRTGGPVSINGQTLLSIYGNYGYTFDGWLDDEEFIMSKRLSRYSLRSRY